MPIQIGDRERVLERQRLVMEQRVKGLSLDELHTWWNTTYPDQKVGRSTIAKDIQTVLERSVQEINLATLEWRQIHIARAEKILSSTKFVKKLEDGDLFAIDRFVKLQDQLIRLTGAYAPTKVTQTDILGENNVSVNLTDDERMKLIEEILGKARERKALSDGTMIDVEAVEVREE